MNNKLLFICFQDIRPAHGISNKIIAQKQAFIKNGINAELAYVHNEKSTYQYIIGHDCIGRTKPINQTLYKLFYSYPFFYRYIKDTNVSSQKKAID